MSTPNALLISALILGLANAAHAGSPPPGAKAGPSVSEHKRVGVEEAGGQNLAAKSDDGDKGGDKGGGKKLATVADDTMGPAFGQASGKVNPAGKSDDGDKGGDKKMPTLNALDASSLAQDPSRGASPTDAQTQQQTGAELTH